MPKIYDSIVIGGGPAGMTAALNILRGGKTCLIIERESFGGQIATSPRVENIPSIKEISGLDFSSQLYDQVESLGCEFEFDQALKIEKENNLFKVECEYNTFEAKSVIIAAGLKHRHLDAINASDLEGNGISYCAVCDGAFYKDQDVAVIGDANTALQYALLLANTSPKVYLCCLFDKMFADKVLIDRVNKNPKIIVTMNISLKEYVKGDDNSLAGLRFTNTLTNEEVNFNCKGAFVAIGQIPDNDKFSNLVDLEKGFIVTNEDCETKTKGLFAIGDCRVKKLRQVTTAVSDGATAAFYASNYCDTIE